MAKTASSPETKPTHDQIAARARAIYEQSGRVPGRDLQNWLQAEAELQTAHNGGSSPAPTVPKPAAPRTSSKTPAPKTPNAQTYA